jgi:hypothetical protein
MIIVRGTLPYVARHVPTEKRRLEDGRQRGRHPACTHTVDRYIFGTTEIKKPKPGGARRSHLGRHQL